MDPTTFAIQCLNAVQYGLLLFLVASGLTLIFGIMGVINLAHGSFYMMGAYLVFGLEPLVNALTGGGFLAAVVVSVIAAALLGYVLEWLFFSYLYERNHLQQVLMTYGLILVFEEVRGIVLGNQVHSVQPPVWLRGSIKLGELLTYPVYPLFVSALCIVLALGLSLVLAKTRLGMTIRAGASNREMVRSLGINITLLYRIIFALGVALSAFAGMLSAPVSSVYPGMGSQVLILSFVVVVIGGVGSVRGAFLASIVIGLVDTFGKVFFSEIAGVLVYVVMAFVLLWKPSGLFKQA
jgi:branched-chain amino acid transport system permease protein